jgi:hypothetical protein
MSHKIILLPLEKRELVQNTHPNTNKIKEIEMLSGQETTHNTAIEKEKQKRVITHTKKWTFTEEDYTKESQIALLKSISTLYANDNTNMATKTNQQTCVLQQLNQKLAGYKNQDVIKDIYNPYAFVSLHSVIQLLLDSDLQCHYCKKDIMVLYEIVREPLQWTLDRINNDLGHNNGNLFISCLSCNLRRKTIYHERYVMTKKCSNVVKLP